MTSFTLSRRQLVKAAMLSGAAAMVFAPGALMAQTKPGGMTKGTARGVARWIDGAAPATHGGQSFGMAWPRGVLAKGRALAATDGQSGAVPLQSWPMAYWPDGSVKWTGHAVDADGVSGDKVTIAPGKAMLPAAPVSVTRTASGFEIRQGVRRWLVHGSGPDILGEVTVETSGGTRTVSRRTRLTGALAASPDGGTRRPLTAQTDAAVLEQSGPVRAVVKLTGRLMDDGAQVASFCLRLIAFAGADRLDIVHSLIWEGDASAQAISALGLETTVPLNEAPLHDRHVRIALSNKRLFAEATRPLTGLRRDPGQDVRAAQIAGEAAPPPEAMNPAIGSKLDRIPAWGDFRLDQLSPDGFTLLKRTGAGQGWIESDAGTRAPGFASLSTPTGGMGIAAHDFWQSYPSGLELQGAATDGTDAAGTLTLWFWSPRAQPMDLRPYRGVLGMEGFDAQNEGLDVTYEDYEPGYDDANGIGRTSRISLFAFAATPDASRLLALANEAAMSPRLIATPETVAAASVFTPWGLPDRRTPARERLENQLDALVDFYADEVEQRRWYGYWHFGDVMHTYDKDRAQWRYDIGGYAWANSELSPDLWLWYAAMRSGDARTFRLAEAMTRHTGEVDSYHSGRFMGLGTRHGVQHFSESSKQPRVANAIYRRIYYYLTADERTGDLMDELLQSDQSLKSIDIGRKIPGRKPVTPPPGMYEMGFGTVWSTLCGAWLAKWERTGDPKWRRHIVAGMRSIAAMPNGWLSGGAFYDPATGAFQNRGEAWGISHLSAVFGAFEVQAELLTLIDEPAYKRAWVEYCVYYNAPADAFEKRFGRRPGTHNLKQGHSRLTGYAAVELNDPALARRAVAEFYSGEAGLPTVASDPRVTLENGLVEWPSVSTNAASQWGLAAIQLLAMLPEALDDGEFESGA